MSPSRWKHTLVEGFYNSSLCWCQVRSLFNQHVNMHNTIIACIHCMYIYILYVYIHCMYIYTLYLYIYTHCIYIYIHCLYTDEQKQCVMHTSPICKNPAETLLVSLPLENNSPISCLNKCFPVRLVKCSGKNLGAKNQSPRWVGSRNQPTKNRSVEDFR